MFTDKWFALNGAGTISYLGEFETFDDADFHAEDMLNDVGVVWIVDEETARDWLETLQEHLGE